MQTKYEITFTEDNQVVFKTDLSLDDSNLNDIHPTLLLLTDGEIECLKLMCESTYHRAMTNSNIHNIPISPNLITLSDKVENYVG